MDCVVDASVGVKLFVQEDGSDDAMRLFHHLADDPPAKIYVPDLFFSECANVLWKYAHFYDYPPENARQDVDALQALDLGSVSTSNLIAPALDMALDFGITVYDACYAALAQMIEIPLVTADRELLAKLDGSGIKRFDLDESWGE